MTNGISALLSHPLALLLTGGSREATNIEPKLPAAYVGVFITIDTILHEIVGFFIGKTWGYTFIGYASKKHFWPGMIAFILASIVGSSQFVG